MVQDAGHEGEGAGLADAVTFATKTECRLCGGTNLERALDLGHTPLANAYEKEDDPPSTSYPLCVMSCPTCRHAQLSCVVDPSVLYRDYRYRTASSNREDVHRAHPLVRQFSDYARSMVRRHRPELVVDVGSNDGTFLRSFADWGVRAVGVDPAGTVKPGDVDTIEGFFNEEAMEKVLASAGLPDLITANNVFAHIDDLSAALDTAQLYLRPGGHLVMQVSYLDDLLRLGLFDTIYHEHLDYHHVTPLVGFFERHGLRVVHAERVPMYGGSVRLTARHAEESESYNPTVARFLEYEAEQGTGSLERWARLGERIATGGESFRDQIADRILTGFGAPAKATTLIHQWQIEASIACMMDDTPEKQDRYMPGTSIPIIPFGALEEDDDGVLVFAWNFLTAATKRMGEDRTYFVPRLPAE